MQAARALERTLRIELDKGVPSQAGLGGGSADAAALLRAFDGSYELASQLGSDVPFFMQATPARMRGRGEILEPVARADLACDRRGTAVRAARPPRCTARGTNSAVRSPNGSSSYPGLDEDVVNDLEPAAEHVEPRLRAFRARLEGAIGCPAMLSGSGSAYSAGFAVAADAYAAADAARTAGITSVWATTTVAG